MKTPAIPIKNSPKILTGAIVFSFVVICYLLLLGQVSQIVMLGGVLFGLWLSMKFPLLLVVGLILCGVPSFLPDEFIQSTPARGLRPVDLVILAMIGGAGLKFLTSPTANLRSQKEIWLLLSCFSLYCMVQVIRNYSEYGMSAPGEFRFRYFGIFPAFYIAIMFETLESRERLLRALIIVVLLGGLLVFAGFFLRNIAAVFLETHYTAAVTSLGIAYGFLALFLSVRYKVVRIRKWAYLFIGLITLAAILLDQHRSVWLASASILCALIFLREIKSSRLIVFASVVLLLVCTAFLAVPEKASRAGEYFGVRALAFTNPQMDPNTFWRQVVTKGYLEKINKAPMFGDGFGGYWDMYIPELAARTEVAPHNYYIIHLVKLGVVGLLMYLVLASAIAMKLFSSLRNKAPLAKNDVPILVCALVVLAVSHIYYFTNNLDYYSWIFIGLGLAAVRR